MAEQLALKFEQVKRKANSGDIVQDLKNGYVFFDAHLDANGKKFVLEKRIRLDKPERMLNKFVTKVKALAEEQYKEEKYYVANKMASSVDVVLENEDDVNERMSHVFGEIDKYRRTSNLAVLATDSVVFK